MTVIALGDLGGTPTPRPPIGRTDLTSFRGVPALRERAVGRDGEDRLGTLTRIDRR